MADITLNQVNMTLLQQNESQEEMRKDIAGLRKDFSDYFKFLKQSKLDELEEKREARNQKASAPSRAQVVKKDDGFGLGMLGPIIGAVITAGIAGLEALKDYFGKLRAMALGLNKGLGPLAKMLGGVARMIGNLMKALGKTLDSKLFSGAIGRALKRIADSIDDFFKPIRRFFTESPKNFRARFSAITTRIGTFFDDLLKPMQTFFRNFSAGFNKIGTRALGVVDDVIKMEDFQTIAGRIGATLRTLIQKPFDALFSSFKTAEGSDDLKKLGDILADFFKPIREFFSISEDSFLGRTWKNIKSAFSIFDEGSVFMKTLGAIGRTIGKLAWPVTVIFGIIDSVTGYFKEYVDDDGTLKKGGLIGSLSGLLEGLVGMPLDLIKSAVSWIAGKFGATKVEDFLDSFSITDMIRNIIMTPLAAVQSALNTIIEAIAKFIEDSTVLSKLINPETIRGLKVQQTATLQTTKDMRVKPTDSGQELAKQAGVNNSVGGEFGGTQIVGKVGDDVTIGSSSTTMTPDALAATDPNTFGSGTSD